MAAVATGLSLAAVEIYFRWEEKLSRNPAEEVFLSSGIPGTARDEKLVRSIDGRGNRRLAGEILDVLKANHAV